MKVGEKGERKRERKRKGWLATEPFSNLAQSAQ